MKKLAVCLHFYYREQLEKVLTYLKNLRRVDYDLFVTLSQESQEDADQFRHIKPDAKIWVAPNRGYDVGPFIDFLHQIDLDRYDYVLKIHTKNCHSKNYTWLNRNRMDGELWNQILWDAVLKNESRVQKNLGFLDKNPKTGMLSSTYCLTSGQVNYQKLLPAINQELKKMDFKPVSVLKFVAGTIFYVRSSLLKPFLRYHLHDFDKTDASVAEGTLAHVIERLFGNVVEQQGYQIRGIRHDNYTIKFLWIAFKRFLYQKKVTNSNRKIIKIMKLPVYSRKYHDGINKSFGA